MDKTPAEQLAERGFQLERDVFGQLVLTDADSRRDSGVEPGFGRIPFLAPSSGCRFAMRRDTRCFRGGDMEKLPSDLRSMLEEELSRREFVPTINDILQSSRR